MKPLAIAVASFALALSSTATFAYESGDLVLRAGVATVAPDDKSDGIAVPALGVTPIVGTSAYADNNTQLGLTVSYMFSQYSGVELLAATPFTHGITADLTAFNAAVGKVNAGETTHLPPTVSFVYYPMGSADAFKPYVGAGLNYTIFFEEDASADVEALTGVLAGAAGPVPLKLKLDNSVGLALQAGFDYQLDEKWHVNASVRWIDINTDATYTSALGDTITVKNVEIDPYVYQVNVGYTF